MNQTSKRTLLDILRLVTVGALIYLILDTPAIEALGYSFAIASVLILASHFYRRFLFPYIDMEVYAKKALETSLGASIVTLAVCLILIALMLISSMPLRPAG